MWKFTASVSAEDEGTALEFAQKIADYAEQLFESSSVSLVTSLTQKTKSRVEQPVAWMTEESLHRLKCGGSSKGTVPVHCSYSNVARIPLTLAK